MRASDLDESVGPRAPLYHFTAWGNLIDILKADTLGLRGRISLTRNPLHPYHSILRTCLVLDQTKLRTRYRFETLYGDSKDPKTLGHLHTPKPEQEERIVNGPVREVHRYLIRIGVKAQFLKLFDPENADMIDPREAAQLDAVRQYCEQYGIPITAIEPSGINGLPKPGWQRT